jgi:hypothetical protein
MFRELAARAFEERLDGLEVVAPPAQLAAGGTEEEFGVASSHDGKNEVQDLVAQSRRDGDNPRFLAWPSILAEPILRAGIPRISAICLRFWSARKERQYSSGSGVGASLLS